MSVRSLRGRAAVAGVGETTYYRHSQAPEPEFVMCLKAILAACADAGIEMCIRDSFMVREAVRRARLDQDDLDGIV